MRVKQLLLIGLCSMPLFACGNKDSEFAKYMVSKEEFFAAIHFEGVFYLQEFQDKTSEYHQIESYSPNACSEATYDSETSEKISENRIFKENDSYSLYRFKLSGGWTGPTNVPERYFESIKQKGEKLVKFLESLKIDKYEDYTFMPEKKAYHVDVPPTSNDDEPTTACELFFEDKKMIAIKEIFETSSEYTTFTYDEIIIRKPEVTSNLK